jgi:hypothetical protein
MLSCNQDKDKLWLMVLAVLPAASNEKLDFIHSFYQCSCANIVAP